MSFEHNIFTDNKYTLVHYEENHLNQVSFNQPR